MKAKFKSREYNSEGKIDPRSVVEIEVKVEYIMDEELLYCMESQACDSVVVLATNRTQTTIDNRQWKLDVL
ncbi:hypothetical protein BLD44_028585 [Mastigocladus laminosus UU774]|nr:hypothetical protein BLD44_028585 [Mastigocladus laminosus UU774]